MCSSDLVPVSVHDADSATKKEYTLHLTRRNLNDELKSIIVTTSGGDSDNLVGTKKVVTIEGKQYDSYDYVMDVTSPDFSDEQKVDIFVQTVDMFAKVVGGRGNVADPTADATDKWIAKDQYLDGTELTTYVIKSRSADGAGIRSSLLNIYKRTPNTKLTSYPGSLISPLQILLLQ